MAMPETTRGWLEHYERLQEKNEQTYQETGDGRYDNAAYKYEMICTAFRALLEKEDDRDTTMAKRIRNKNAAVERLIAQKYTRDEVVKMLEDAVWW